MLLYLMFCELFLISNSSYYLCLKYVSFDGLKVEAYESEDPLLKIISDL